MTLHANPVCWLTVLGIGVVALVPWATWDVVKAGRELWTDIDVE